MKWILVSLGTLNESNFLKNTDPVQAKILFFGTIAISILVIMYLLYQILSDKNGKANERI